jgi:hypothetical protein
MKKFFIVVPLVILLVATLYACTSQSAMPDTTNALFFDDFSQSSSGWTQLQDNNGTIGYDNNHYHILVNNLDTMLIGTAGQSLQDDVRIEVDARKIGGSDNNYFGVICRYQNPDNYYMFLITSDGLSGIVMLKNGTPQMISPGAHFLKMDGIKKASATNHIRVDCIGDALTLYANDKQVSATYDHTFIGGDVGLVARSSLLEAGVDIQFDNLVVYDPAQP